MIETLFYIHTMTFSLDTLPTPRTYRRAKLLIFSITWRWSSSSHCSTWPGNTSTSR